MPNEIINSLPEGTGNFTALVTVVLAFIACIKYLIDKTEQRISSMAADHAASRTAFQDQIKLLTDKVLGIAENTTNAIRSLENAFRELKEKIK